MSVTPIGIEKTSPPAFDIKSPLDISKWNPVGDEVPTIATEKQKALDAQEKLVKALEDRYANPNYFRVAAGFLKPQLGGFFASLGSASEALGENVEAQRAIAPTIERMRAEVAQGRIGLETNKEQSRLIDEYDAKGLNDTAKLRKIYSLAPNSDVGQSILKRLELEAGRRAETGFNIDLQKAVLDNPALVINDPNYKGIPTSPESSAKFVNMVNSAIPPSVRPEEWSAMGFSAKQNAIAKYQDEKIKQGMGEGEKFGVDAGRAHDVLDSLADLRQLATDKSLQPVFSVALNGDIFSMLRAYMDKNPGNAGNAIEGVVAAAMKNIQNPDNATRAKVDKLIKNIYALEMRLRGSTINPTDATATLISASSPSLANSQGGFVGILDQLALGASRDIGVSKLYQELRSKGMNVSDAQFTSTMENYRKQMRDLSRQYATQYPDDKFPEWYGIRNQSATPAPAGSAPKPSAPAAATSAQPPAGSTWEQLQAWKKSQAQKP
jgi:hypothetical protein